MNAARVRRVKVRLASSNSAPDDGKRSFGSLAIPLWITSSSEAGSSGRVSVSVGGSSAMCAYSTAASESFGKGTSPDRAS